jgi:PAS domain S-box-containing protein
MRIHLDLRSERFSYTQLLLRIIPLVIGVPFLVVVFTDLRGSTIQEVVHSTYEMIASPDSFYTFWPLMILPAIGMLWFLHPVSRFYSSCAVNNRCTREDAERVICLFNKMNGIILFVCLIAFFLGEVAGKLATRDWGIETASKQFSMLNALAKGLLTGTILSFNLENILFPAKKAALALGPTTPLRRTSLYKRIFLIVAAIVLFMLCQFIAMSGQLALIGAASIEPDEFRPGFDFLGDHEMLPIVHEAKKLVTLRILVFIFFVLQLMQQIKQMIKKPIDTMREKLAMLVSGTAAGASTIDVLTNDEFASVFREINVLLERQRGELKCSTLRLEAILDQAADPIVSFTESGEIMVFNPAAEAFFGYSRDEAIGSSILRMIELPPESGALCGDCAPERALIDLLYGKAEGIKRFVALRKDGSRAFFESNASKADNNGEQIYTAVIRDVARQIEMEKNLTNAKTAAENANRMKSEFLANMSHELRTPLNAVLGFTQLLGSDKNLTEGQLEKIGIVSRSGEHLLSLINDILDISKIEAGKVDLHESVFDLARFVDDIREMFSLRCKKAGLTLYVELAGELPRAVRGDLGKLRQVMINLVGNAVKFTDEGGIGIIVGPDAGKVRFSVTDSGKGIPSGELELIMQPFTQASTTDNEGGTGLGLAISSRYVQMMGGSLSVQSEVGKGSTFSFAIELPETDEPVPASGEAPVAIALKKGTEVTALIVDDKELNRLVLKEMLGGAGFATIEAENGKVAYELARERKPDLVFMDIKMPVMDGYESMRLIREDEATRGIPVFALTASAFVNDERKILESGFAGFLAKPFKRSALFQLIRDRTGVELEYETVQPPAESPPDFGSVDFAAAARSLGSDFVDRLAEKAMINDFTAVRELASGIEASQSDLARLLRYYAGEFDEAGIARALDALRAALRAAR